ncbi:MAG TPA: Ni/Fe hydrogenase subunit alpha [Terrimicrobiaceae bacterium]|nr:Ni/Fe hydrogenase subunit alpha [Terrimicrobiaceae bacterium]
MRSRSITVDYLTRVEGEGALHVKIADGRVADVKLKIFEPPRFFEALLRGRHAREAPDITARICGICPVAYMMSAVHAVEDACGVGVGGQLRALRRLIYCGEWIESHVLHIYMLHAPDFLGYESALHMARDLPEVVQRGLQLKKVGNEIVRVLGGREIHPINVRVGGFFKLPGKKDLEALAERLTWARDAAIETIRWVAGFPFPDFEQEYQFVALHHPAEYPFNEGRILSSMGQEIDVRDFEEHFIEEQVPYSSALHCLRHGRDAYHVGPMARFNLNFDQLALSARQAAQEVGLSGACRNPFQSIVVRAIEVLHACEEALRLIADYEPPDLPAIEIPMRAGVGYACTEAPRGMLFHRYRLDEEGVILEANIVPPTSQNQRTIERDLRELVMRSLDAPTDQLTRRCEAAIRNYDPCISCSAHFLKLSLERN